MDARHHDQQSWVHLVLQEATRKLFIWPQDEVITKAAAPDGKVLKRTIPATERLVALQELDTMNVNAFSLYGSEQALVRTVARRELLFKR